MKIDIQARSFILTKALKRYAEQKVKSSLSACGSNLKKVVIRLSDINGPRGGEDKLCHIQVMLAGMPDVIIKNTQQDMYAAIDVATHRAGNAAVRRLNRHRRRERNYSQSLSQHLVA